MLHSDCAANAAGEYEVPFLCRAVRQHVGTTTAHYLLLLLLTSSGMFTASTALLPSSFAMYALTAAAAALIRRHLCKAEAWAVVRMPFVHCKPVTPFAETVLRLHEYPAHQAAPPMAC